jgi:hypothetical protein
LSRRYAITADFCGGRRHKNKAKKNGAKRRARCYIFAVGKPLFAAIFGGDEK